MKLLLIFFFLCPLLSFSFSGPVRAGSVSANTNKKIIEEVFDALCSSGIRNPEIVMRQVILETGWLKSPFLMKRNNLFGFRSKEYLRFEDWRESVTYYLKWQKKYYLNSNENYYDFLKRIKYAQAKNYIDVLKKISWAGKCSSQDPKRS